MRAHRGTVAGWLVVGLYAAGLLAAGATTHDGSLRPGDRPDGGAAARALIDAWERSRTATFVRVGTFERRSELTGAAIKSEDVLAQRPPRRLHRALGGVDGHNDDRAIVCPAGAGQRRLAPCHLGKPGGPTYDESVAQEIAGLHSILDMPAPLYAVARADESGCFDLAQLRPEPRAPFGIEARFCFDAATGAPASSRVRYQGGIVETVTLTEIRAAVRAGDLEP